MQIFIPPALIHIYAWKDHGMDMELEENGRNFVPALFAISPVWSYSSVMGEWSNLRLIASFIGLLLLWNYTTSVTSKMPVTRRGISEPQFWEKINHSWWACSIIIVLQLDHNMDCSNCIQLHHNRPITPSIESWAKNKWNLELYQSTNYSLDSTNLFQNKQYATMSNEEYVLKCDKVWTSMAISVLTQKGNIGKLWRYDTR
jgi:hypothetical protein